MGPYRGDELGAPTRTRCALGHAPGSLRAVPDDPYASLPPDRAAAVRAWLSTPVGTCRVCGELVYPTDSRQRDPQQSNESIKAPLHLSCLLAEKAGENHANPPE